MLYSDIAGDNAAAAAFGNGQQVVPFLHIEQIIFLTRYQQAFDLVQGINYGAARQKDSGGQDDDEPADLLQNSGRKSEGPEPDNEINDAEYV